MNYQQQRIASYQPCFYQQYIINNVKLEYNISSKIEIVSTFGETALKQCSKAKKSSKNPRKSIPSLTTYDIDTLSIKIEENSNTPQSHTTLNLQNQGQQQQGSQQEQKSQQSIVKNANKYYFKKILQFLNNSTVQHPSFPQEDVNEILLNIKNSGKKENYTLKHFRAVSLKISEENRNSMKIEDINAHKAIFESVYGDDEGKINSFKQFLTEQILNFLENDRNIENDIYQKYKDQQIQQRYLNWKKNISINLRKMLRGQYVTRF